MDNPLEALLMMCVMQTLNKNGGYGGVDLCIKCKEKGLNRTEDVNGAEIDLCETCLNNMQAVKWDG